MITALTGRTTEPVNRNSTISVAATITASTTGRWAPRLCSRSTKAAVWPGDADVERRVERADVVDQLLRRVAERRLDRRDAISDVVAAGRLRRRDRRHVRQPARARRGAPAACGERGGRADDDLERLRCGSAGTRVRARRRPGARSRCAGSTLALTVTNLMPSERDPERDQDARRWRSRSAPGRRITNRDSRYQAPLCGGPRVAVGGALQPLRRERVDARAEHGQQRREHEQRERRREQRDERAGDPHRVQEPLREDRQRRDRGGDRDRAEQDRPPGGLQRAAERLDARSPDCAASSR